MKNKVTLITPPDFFENSSYSLLLININEHDQEKISKYLANLDIDQHLNIYFYSGEPNIDWLLYALARTDAVFIDLDNADKIVTALSGYIVSRPLVRYQTHDEVISKIYQHINSNQVPDIDFFLEEIFKPSIVKN
jgi:hypothetical protein